MVSETGIIESIGAVRNGLVLLHMVSDAIPTLRAHLEDGRARWGAPAVEVRYPLARPEGGEGWKEVVEAGDWVGWVEGVDIGAAAAAMTGWLGSVERVKGGVDVFPTNRTPAAVADWVKKRDGGRVGIHFRRDDWEGSWSPPWLGPSASSIDDDLDDAPPGFLPVEFAWEGVKGELDAVLFPLKVAADGSEAWWSLGVGIRWTAGDPLSLAERDVVGLWLAIKRAVGVAYWDAIGIQSVGIPDHPAVAQGGMVPHNPLNARPAGAEVVRVLNRPTKVDRSILALLDAMRQQTLPATASAMRHWDDLKAAEVQRLKADHGEQAFGKRVLEGVQGPLLQRVYTGAGGGGVEELTRAGERALEAREGPRGFRRTIDGVERLVRVWAAGDDTITLAWSWAKCADFLSTAKVEAERKALEEEEEEEERRLIKSPEAERSKRRRRIALLGSVEDARKVLHLALALYGSAPAFGPHQQVRIPRAQLEALLDIDEGHPRGLARLEAAFRILRELEVVGDATVDGVTSRLEGGVVSEWGWDGRAAGERSKKNDASTRKRKAPPSGGVVGRDIGDRAGREAVFHLTLTDRAVSGLQAFFLSNPDLVAEVPKLSYAPTSTLSPFVDALLSRHQSLLAQWVREQITTNADPTTRAGVKVDRRNGRSTPRAYGPDFSPLLPAGVEYWGALGRFIHNPERGFTIAGVMSRWGRRRPNRRHATAALAVAAEVVDDLEKVVVDTFGGVVAWRDGGGWFGFTEARRRGAAILEVPFFAFVPRDYAHREGKVVEDHHRERRRQGRTRRVVEVTDDATAYTSQITPPDAMDDATRLEVGGLRRRLRLSQDHLAKVVGVHRRALSRWEQGKGTLSPEASHRLLEWFARGGTIPDK
jgi:DNA-binding transcriptional regulator YiaG